MHSPLDRRVPCPYCHARTEERCIDAQADRVNWCHAVRMTEARNLDQAKLLDRLMKLEERVASLEKRSNV